MPVPGPVRPSAGQAYVGLAVLGWGLSILTGVTPHEDPWVGAALTLFGLALVATAPRLPTMVHASGRTLVITGGVAVVGILGYNFAFQAPFDTTKVVILAFGTALLVAAPLAARDVRLPTRGRPKMKVGTIASLFLPVLGAPLAVWVFQATFKSVLGQTPIELFIRFALLIPIEGLLILFGWHPFVAGQTLTYNTPRGPLSVDVGAACSGVQAMALFCGVLALFLLSERPTGRRLAFWSIVGVLGVYATNLVRLATIIAVGHAWGPAALLQTHAQAGWIFFVAWAILFAWLARSPMQPIQARPGGTM